MTTTVGLLLLCHMDKKTQQIVGAGAAVLVLIAGIMLFHKKPATNVVTDTTGTSTEVAASAITDATGTPSEALAGTGLPRAKMIKANSNESVEVADQAAGNSVAVSNLKIESKTWVVVYDTDVNGEPSWPMGAGLAWPGNDTFVTTLMRSTSAGKTYYVALIKDDGTMKFDLRTVRPSETSPVVSFKAI